MTIPAELRERPQWVAWKYVDRGGKPTKVPITCTGRNAKSDDAATWGAFDEARAAVERFELEGTGYVFSAEDPYCGIDLDACRNPATGDLTEWAERIVKQLDSYTDVSPSGYGVKIIVRGKLKPGHNVKKLKGVPTFGDKAPEIALYDHKRFWCLTGERHGTADIADRQAELDALFDELWPPKAPAPRATVGVLGDWFDELATACAIANEGERSERDYALCAECIRQGCNSDDVFERVKDSGKFLAKGREYFDRTWGKAKESVEAESPLYAGGRTLIEITTAENEINAKVAKLLGSDPTLFVRGGALAMIGDVDGESTIMRVPDALTRDRIAAHVQFWIWKECKSGFKRSPKHPPDWCVKAIASWPDWSHLRPLRGVVNVPTLRPDGSLLDAPGYDSATQLFYVASDCRPTVASEPTHDDAKAACNLLLDVFCDFPFAKESHRAACLADLLTLVGRHTYDGPAPLFAIDATTAGTGKGLLADTNFSIAFGKPAYRWPNPASDDEARKRITTLAITGRPAVLIDNVAGVFGSPAMDSALTATSWGDRILGVNKDVQLPLKVVWNLTANNLIVGGDTGRRICPIRLESKDERPEERTGFKHPELLAHVKTHRAELLGACLTILRAWFVAGRPRQPLPAWGSFEAWSAVIRQAIVWLGLPDPADARDAFRTIADRDAASLRELLDGIAALDPEGKGLKAAEIVERADEVTGLRAALAELCGDKLNAKAVGNKLAGIRGRIMGGRYLDAHALRGRYQGWLVRSAEIAA